MPCRMCSAPTSSIEFDGIRTLNASCTYRRWPSLQISPAVCRSPEVKIVYKCWRCVFVFVLLWCNFSQQCWSNCYHFLCNLEVFPLPLWKACSAIPSGIVLPLTQYLVLYSHFILHIWCRCWNLGRLNLLVVPMTGKLSSTQTRTRTCTIYSSFFFSRLCALCLHTYHMYLYCMFHVCWVHSYKDASMPTHLWFPLPTDSSTYFDMAHNNK